MINFPNLVSLKLYYIEEGMRFWSVG